VYRECVCLLEEEEIEYDEITYLAKLGVYFEKKYFDLLN
jgi:hypothetical protein